MLPDVRAIHADLQMSRVEIADEKNGTASPTTIEP